MVYISYPNHHLSNKDRQALIAKVEQLIPTAKRMQVDETITADGTTYVGKLQVNPSGDAEFTIISAIAVKPKAESTAATTKPATTAPAKPATKQATATKRASAGKSTATKKAAATKAAPKK